MLSLCAGVNLIPLVSVNVLLLGFDKKQHFYISQQILSKVSQTSSAQTSQLIIVLIGPTFPQAQTLIPYMPALPPSLHYFPLDLVKSSLHKLMIRLLNKTLQNDTWAVVKLLNCDPCLQAWP